MNVTDHLVIQISACFASGVRSNFHGGGFWFRVIWWSFAFGVRCL